MACRRWSIFVAERSGRAMGIFVCFTFLKDGIFPRHFKSVVRLYWAVCQFLVLSFEVSLVEYGNTRCGYENPC